MSNPLEFPSSSPYHTQRQRVRMCQCYTIYIIILYWLCTSLLYLVIEQRY